MDCELPIGAYGGALEHFCRPHENLPSDTETAVVYYLPQDSHHGFSIPASCLIDRRKWQELLLAANQVFEGKYLGPDRVVPAGRERLRDLLNSLDITLLKDSQAER